MSEAPYPGPRPFEAEEADRFFGRDREREQIVSLVIAHRAVLLYAASGAGKTSLISAGVLPDLRREGAETLRVGRVRALSGPVGDGAAPASASVHNLLLSLHDPTDAPPGVADTLPDYLRRAISGGPRSDAALHVLVVDQLEELFAAHPSNRSAQAEFFIQLADALEAVPTLRVLLSIREDYLAACDSHRDILPGRLRARFRLEPLGPRAARLAFEKPLERMGRSCAPGVGERLIDRLRTVSSGSADAQVLDDYVEPVHLQVVCRDLWNSLPADVRIVTDEHLSTRGDVDKALGRYYDDAVRSAARAGGVQELEVRRWFHSRLITRAGTRGTVFREETTAGELPLDAVEALERWRIIRSEFRARGQWYELTHDRLIRPILESNRRTIGVPQDDQITGSGAGTRDYLILNVDEIVQISSFDEEGSGVLERRWSGIIVTQNIVDLRIPFLLHVDAAGGSEIPPASVQSLGPDTPVEFVPRTSEPGTAGGDVIVKGHLAAGTKISGFVVRQPFVRSIATDLKTAAEAYANSPWKAEYVGVSAPFVITRLRLEVKFPASHHHLKPPPRAVAFLFRSETVLERMTEELRQKMEYSGTEAKLQVREPQPNVTYAISWLPPDRSEGTG